MHGYPQFSFWIPRVLTKIYFLRVVLNPAKNIPALVSIGDRKSGDAQNVCTITIVGTILKPILFDLVQLSVVSFHLNNIHEKISPFRLVKSSAVFF